MCLDQETYLVLSAESVLSLCAWVPAEVVKHFSQFKSYCFFHALHVVSAWEEKLAVIFLICVSGVSLGYDVGLVQIQYRDSISRIHFLSF